MCCGGEPAEQPRALLSPRRAATARGIACITTISGGMAATRAIIAAARGGEPPVVSLQEIHAQLQGSPA